jgi:hypothetical protein
MKIGQLVIMTPKALKYHNNIVNTFQAFSVKQKIDEEEFTNALREYIAVNGVGIVFSIETEGVVKVAFANKLGNFTHACVGCYETSDLKKV